MKIWKKSKTIWAGLLYFGLGFFDVVMGEQVVCTIYGFKAGWLLMVIGVLNIILRFLTNKKLRFKNG